MCNFPSRETELLSAFLARKESETDSKTTTSHSAGPLDHNEVGVLGTDFRAAPPTRGLPRLQVLRVNSCECPCHGWRRFERKEVGRVRSVKGEALGLLVLGHEAQFRVHGGLRLPS